MPTDQVTEYDDQSLQPTSVTEWGAKKAVADEGMILELPSGNVCRVRRTMDMLTMLQAGKIPNPLAKVINNMIENGEEDFAKAAKDSSDPETVRQFFSLLNSTMERAFVEPPVDSPKPRTSEESWDDYMERVKDWKPEQGKLSVFDIEMEDKMYVMAVAQGAAADLARFRNEQESIMGAVQASQRVVEPTKRTGGGGSKN